MADSENEHPEPKATVLVVDDERAYCKAVADILTRHGYAVEQASSAREATRMLEQLTPDVILLDIMMPEVDGLTWLRQIAREPRWLHTQLVIVSALGQTANRADAWRSGAGAYLTKPYTPEELLGVVGRVLGEEEPETAS